MLIREHETAEALQLLAADQADLALTYDFSLAPAATDPAISSSRLWTARWGLAVQAREASGGGTAPEVFARFRAHDWIGNSRSTADEDVIRTLASMAGFTPRITHRADSLEPDPGHDHRGAWRGTAASQPPGHRPGCESCRSPVRTSNCGPTPPPAAAA